ncbi:polyhydroxyalkanoate depolymerase [Paucibacter sp. O1-1]|nr:polyhydroxyalkanoate depolymerase [Paucibacter sp. O1-1]MDA3829416.1 polyhydroxyalkanoate depolymerase [Paucibacter sp. O1-1]
MLYQAYQLQSDLTSPLRLMAQQLAASLWFQRTEKSALRSIAAASDVISRMRLTHTRPPYAIADVDELPILKLPFGTLLHFRKTGPAPETRPRVLLVAPLSGHFATLLRETARTLLQDHDVFITDWHNARDVALRHGAFSLDDYIDYMMQFIAAIGPDTHVIAVCQPCVAALAATALMAEDMHPAQPRSLTLMAGPVDCRVNPTEVNRLAISKPIEWFAQNLLSHVPLPHAGFGRRVYPGFLQLTAFMSMNPERHKASFRQMYEHLLEGRREEAKVIQDFYEEYLAVNDLPAEFYLETVEKVFQTYDLAKGELMYRGRLVRPAAIRRTALMTVEGERDDICAVGQTVAAQDLCPNVRPYLKTHHIQTGVGHYGVFSGRKWMQQIYPRVREHIHASAG